MSHTADGVRIRLQAEASKLGSQRALAKKIGCSSAFLNEVINGTREPAGPILDYLGMVRQVRYVFDPHMRKSP